MSYVMENEMSQHVVCHDINCVSFTTLMYMSQLFQHPYYHIMAKLLRGKTFTVTRKNSFHWKSFTDDVAVSAII